MGAGDRTWRAEGHRLTIRYSDALMESIRRAAVAGLQKIPKRGLEVGGVLFGNRQGDEIRIVQWREIPCEHAGGPGFELSDNDCERLARFLEDAAGDPELKGLTPVGWFRTRTRGDVALGESDVILHDRFFPEPWQVILVQRPHMYEPTRAGFFFREDDGGIRTDSSHNVFTLEAPPRRLPLGFDPAQPPLRPGEALSVLTPTAPAAERVEPAMPRPGPPLAARPGQEPPAKRRRRWILALAAAAVLTAAAIFLAAPALAPAVPEHIALRLREAEGQLIVEWNHSAKPIQEAQAATLTIVDGGKTRQVRLDPEELRGGTLTYVRRSGAVEARLALERPGSEPLSVTARFSGPEPPPAIEPPAASPSTAELSAEADRLRQELEREEKRAERLRRQVEAEAAALERATARR